jgi:membrane protease YdiL (CAAX protease family)
MASHLDGSQHRGAGSSSRPDSGIEDPRLLAYFGFVFTFTWALWFLASAVAVPLLKAVALYVGVFMPGIVALVFTYHRRGLAGVRSLLARLVKADVGAKWFAFALFFMAAVKLVVAIIVRAATGAWPIFGAESVPLMFGAAIASTMLGGQVGEELGWRGYALPRLSRSFGVGPASIILGITWAAWHLPLFFILNADKVGQSFPYYLLQATAISIALAWAYMKSGGSLLITMLLHAAINNTKDIVPSAVSGASNPWRLHASLVGWLTLAILWLCAAWFLFDTRRDQTVAGLAES